MASKSSTSYSGSPPPAPSLSAPAYDGPTAGLEITELNSVLTYLHTLFLIAIFERDIEPIGSESLEQSVPSVLDSAAAILSTLETDAGDVADQVAVVAPAASPISLDNMGGRSGFASPIGTFEVAAQVPLASSGLPPQLISSAISSPPVSVLGLHVTSAVASPAAGSGPSTSASSPSSKPQVIRAVDAATISQVHGPSATSTTTPSIITLSRDHEPPVPITSGSEQGSEPPTTTQEHPPALPTTQSSPRRSPSSLPLQPLSLASPHSISSATSPISSPSSAHLTLSSHPPSPIHLQPLSSLTTCASAVEPPPHIPSVSGLNLVNAIHAQQQQSPHRALEARHLFEGLPYLVGRSYSGVTHAGMRDSISLLDNVGGEWERQGLGKGLEERLDALVIPPAGGLPLSPVSPAVRPHSVVGSKA
ncbi:hypothetical protein CPB84DRAFT_1851952 [Gymnopilus junonius]|uniref:Uncharacterized protein n=1 Tax=Gymnopilus junonius TaxID=109634 RepID=A0A9P5NFB9_GYMJU|nr:hypothetical protein CPB84DRAFT_1851952 [Gymnopilus junonius]